MSPWDFSAEGWPEQDQIAVGADLEPATLVDAYRHGAFPMPGDGHLTWWSPMMRGVLEPGGLRVTRSLARSVRRFSVTVDEAFSDVVDACADPRRTGAWIDADIRAAYVALHELGWAHSVEVRTDDGELVGGLFAGESMFHRAPDASKVALVELDRRWGSLIDTQWSTPHLASLGVVEVPREEYLRRLAVLVEQPDREVW